MVWPSPEPVRLKVFTGTSVLDVPIRPNLPNEAKMRPLQEPVEGPRPTVSIVKPQLGTHHQVRDLIHNRLRITTSRGSGSYRIENNGIEVGGTVSEDMQIAESDPLSARVEIVATARTGRPGSMIDVDARSLLTSDRDLFHLETELCVRENGVSVFSRTWNQKIPRGYL
jgi:hypothetical protein